MALKAFSFQNCLLSMYYVPSTILRHWGYSSENKDSCYYRIRDNSCSATQEAGRETVFISSSPRPCFFPRAQELVPRLPTPGIGVNIMNFFFLDSTEFQDGMEILMAFL